MKVFINGELVREFSQDELLRFTTQDAPNCVTMNFEIQGDCGDLVLPIGNVKVCGNARNVGVQTGSVSVEGDVCGDVKINTGNIQAKLVKGQASTQCGSVFEGGDELTPQCGFSGRGADLSQVGPKGVVGPQGQIGAPEGTPNLPNDKK